MFRLVISPLLASLFLLGSAEAFQIVHDYEIVRTNTLSTSVSSFETTSGLEVFVDCDRNVFDDSTNDYVAHFNGRSECEQFVASVNRSLGRGTGQTIIELRGSQLSIRIRY